MELLSTSDSKDLVMGLDVSTQSVKCGIFSALNMTEVCCVMVNYQNDLPKYNTENGIHVHKDGNTVTSPTMMFVEAIELALSRLKRKAPGAFEKVQAISASGQQHGSVYWKRGAQDTLTTLDPSKSMKEQFDGIFVIEDSPIWMDSSTTKECQELEERIGGAKELAKISGSRAYERFTGNQIQKIYKTKPTEYEDCERISLISSFVVSLFLGDYAPIDISDGSGMNLLDISTKLWSKDLFTAPGLADKLGVPVQSSYSCGDISKYMQSRYGFAAGCKVIAGSGDNPCSLAGLMVSKRGDVCVSLGTSDTLFAVVENPSPGEQGHILCSPIHLDSYIAMLCFKNGSIVREKCKENFASSSWTRFSEILATSPPGNNGYFGFYYLEPEIIPNCRAVTRRIGSTGIGCWRFDASTEIRAVVESQFLNMKAHAESVGLNFVSRIIATGGASQNLEILQVLSDVFGVPVFIADSGPQTAMTGAALRALHGLLCHRAGKYVPFSSLSSVGPKLVLKCKPNEQVRETYDILMKRRHKAEVELLKTHRL